MLDHLNDTDETIYLKKNSIDRSVAYLVVGILALLFFLLTIMGMGRLQQTISNDATSPNRTESQERSPEIGDTPITDVNR